MIKNIKATELLESTKEGFSIVDIYSNFCMPCKALANTLETLAFDYPFLNIFKICTEDNEEFCSDHCIMSVPTMFFMVDGKIVERITGSLSGNEIMEIASKYMY